MTSVFQEGVFFTVPDPRQVGPNINKININTVQCVNLTATGSVVLGGISIKESTLVAPAITLDSFKSAASANASVAIIPTGTGSLTTQQPDNTATGGNQRGTNAIDFQMSRTLNTQVASGANAFIGAGVNNTAAAAQSGVMSGSTNTITAGSSQSVIVGGSTNTIFANVPQSFIGAGSGNNLQNPASLGFIGAGTGNQILGSANCFIGGGNANAVTGTTSDNCSILGGNTNVITNAAAASAIVCGANQLLNGGNNSVILGGSNCSTTADYAMAFGNNATANATGAICFTDSTGTNLTNSTANSISLRFANGYSLAGGTTAVSALVINGGTSISTAVSHTSSTLNLQGIWAAPHAMTYNITRIGNLVSFTWSTTVSAASVAATITSATPIASPFALGALITMPIIVDDNGTQGTGAMTIDTSGNITITAKTDGSNFAGAGTSGPIGGTLTWCV